MKKVVRLSFPEFLIRIQSSHDPSHKSIRWYNCCVGMTDNHASEYVWGGNSFTDSETEIFKSFSSSMLTFADQMKQIDGNIIVTETIKQISASNRIYIIDMNNNAKMVCSDLKPFSRLSNPLGQAVACYTMAGVVVLK